MNRSTRWRRAAALVVAVAALEGVALGTAVHTPPIYDGIGNPDEPYRFVDPPAGYRTTAPPTAAQQVIPASNGKSASAYTVNSAEVGPQISVYVDGGAIVTDPAAHRVTLRAEPVSGADDGPVPGHQWGNVYRVTATADTGTARLATGVDAEILLRAPSPQEPGPKFYFHGSDGWRELDTHKPGVDIYQADLVGLGDYVLAAKTPLDVNAQDPNNEAAVGIVGFVVSGLGVVLVIVLFIRAERKRSARRAARGPTG